MRHSTTVLLIPIAFLLTSCSHPIIGTGYIKLLDQDCKPIANRDIQVNNIQPALFLNSGHLTKDVYTTDKHGLIEFDIEKSANKLVIFLPDTTAVKKVDWNWYWTVSNKDEVYFRFLTDRTQTNDFKSELIKSSADNPIIIVHPRQKETCGYQNLALEKYNWQKYFDPKPKPILMDKLPEFTILGYGIIDIYLDPDDKQMHYEIIEEDHFIKKNAQKTGLEFGLFISLSEEPVLDNPSDLSCIAYYPTQGLTNPNTGELIKNDTKCIYKITRKDWILSTKFKEPWYIQSGEWLLQLKYRDTVLLEKSFFVEK